MNNAYRTRFGELRFLTVALICSLGVWATVPSLAQSQTGSEDEIKAAYLYNFVRSAQWPAAHAPAEGKEFVIGVVGQDEEFVGTLRSITHDQSVAGHPVAVRTTTTPGDMIACHLLFVHAIGKDRELWVIQHVHEVPVLVVGEEPWFLELGGMINLFLQNGKIRFEINQAAIEKAGIHFSPSLMRMAEHSRATGSRKLRENPAPVLPELARRMNIRGSVRLDVVVRRDGAVRDVKVIGGNPVLGDALSKAVMNWKYDPGPEETVERVEYRFGQ